MLFLVVFAVDAIRANLISVYYLVGKLTLAGTLAQECKLRVVTSVPVHGPHDKTRPPQDDVVIC